MSKEEIVLALVAAMVAAELFDYACWVALKTVRRAARLRYGDTDRANVRAEEWEALIKARPGQLPKLVTALFFLSSGVYFALVRWARPEAGNVPRVQSQAEIVPEQLISYVGSLFASLAIDGVGTGVVLGILRLAAFLVPPEVTNKWWVVLTAIALSLTIMVIIGQVVRYLIREHLLTPRRMASVSGPGRDTLPWIFASVCLRSLRRAAVAGRLKTNPLGYSGS